MPPELFYVWILLTGLFVGSFLNVAIYRYPLENVTVNNPKRSRCPKCEHTLSWYENVPLLSWLVQLGRCRHCAVGIPCRYPMVEALTAGLWVLAAWRAGGLEHWPLVLVWSLVLSGLVLATFVDFDCMEIPDSVSIGGMVVGPLLALAVPELHAESWIALELSAGSTEGVSRLGSFCASLAGLSVGWGSLFIVSWLGARAFGKEAMGFGDVKLLGAGGAFLGPGGVLLALMLASVLASIAGIGNMVRYYCLIRSRARRRGVPKRVRKAISVARMLGRYLPFGPYLAAGIGIVLLYWNDVLALLLRNTP
ncbi:MAG: leader peptidase (prepilin peptidase)/N-methyltransferase [Planctomycetota bacterium]|jgi:leader peptidase (prepilin peptidase)/N-methyltransferase